MAPPIQSAIWTYFKPHEHDRDKAQCKICRKIYSRKGRSTSPLKNHLKAMHPEEFRLYKRANFLRLTSTSAEMSLEKTATTTSLELLIVNDSEQSESDHGAGPEFAKFQENTEQPLGSPLSHESNTEMPLSRESTSRKRRESNADTLDSFPISKKQRCVYSTAKKQTEEDFSQNRDRSNRNDKEGMVNVVAECVLYGQLLAQKLKPLDVEDRLALMNDIDNLVFKHLMNIRKRSNSSRSEHLSSTNQTHSDRRRSIDLPGPSHRSNQTQYSLKNIQNSPHEVSSRSEHLSSTNQTHSDTQLYIDLPGPSHPSNQTLEDSRRNIQNSPHEVPVGTLIIKTEIKDETDL